MSDSEIKIPTFNLQRAMQWLCLVVLLGTGISLGLIEWRGWSGHLVPCLTAVGATSIAALVSLVLVCRASRDSLARVLICILAGTVVRLAICAGSAALLVVGLTYAKLPTVLWMLGWYLLIMLVEVHMFKHYLRSITAGLSEATVGHDGSGESREVGTCSPAGP